MCESPMADSIVWESDDRYYCVRVWLPVLLCKSMMAGIFVWESDGRY